MGIELNIVCHIDGIKDNIAGKKIVVFGVGEGGQKVSKALELFDLCPVYYLDNYRNGMKYMGRDVFHPNVLLQEKKEMTAVLIASMYVNEIVEQLKEMGFIEQEHVFPVCEPLAGAFKQESWVPPPSSEILLNKVLLHPESDNIELLNFGDSVMSYVSKNDGNKTQLEKLLSDNLTEAGITNAIIHYAGFHLPIFWGLLLDLLSHGWQPKYVVMPINMRSFSPQWNTHPDYCHHGLVYEFWQRHEEFRSDMMFTNEDLRGLSFEEYIHTEEQYYGTGKKINGSFIPWVNYKSTQIEEKHNKYQNLFMWHYMFKLNEKNRRLLLLDNMINWFTVKNIHLICYISPINHKAGEEYVGSTFYEAYRQNLSYIYEVFQKYSHEDIRFVDYSFSLDDNYFIHKNETAEHLNYEGRLVLAKLITDQVLKLRQSLTEGERGHRRG